MKRSPDCGEESSESEFSLRNRGRRKNKKAKKRTGRPAKEEPFIVFERAEIRPSTVESCFYSKLYIEQMQM